MAVLAVAKARIDPEKADAVLREAGDLLRTWMPSPGFISVELLISEDRKTVAVLCEWSDLDTWSRSRYDSHVGKTLEDFVTAGGKLEFEVYERYARIPSDR